MGAKHFSSQSKKEINTAISALAHTLGRKPKAREIAEHLNTYKIAHPNAARWSTTCVANYVSRNYRFKAKTVTIVNKKTVHHGDSDVLDLTTIIMASLISDEKKKHLLGKLFERDNLK